MSHAMVSTSGTPRHLVGHTRGLEVTGFRVSGTVSGVDDDVDEEDITHSDLQS